MHASRNLFGAWDRDEDYERLTFGRRIFHPSDIPEDEEGHFPDIDSITGERSSSLEREYYELALSVLNMAVIDLCDNDDASARGRIVSAVSTLDTIRTNHRGVPMLEVWIAYRKLKGKARDYYICCDQGDVAAYFPLFFMLDRAVFFELFEHARTAPEVIVLYSSSEEEEEPSPRPMKKSPRVVEGELAEGVSGLSLTQF